jgi:hypothetical protein
LTVRLAHAGLLLLVPAAAAVACGYCVEDRIAAAYDHSVIVSSLDRSHEVAFFAIEGAVAPSAGFRREIRTALQSTKGIDRGTERVSNDTTSLSFAYDPARHKLGPIMRAIESRLAPKGLNISLLRVIN